MAQYITPRDDTSTLSSPERTFLRSAARGTLSSSSSLLRLDGRAPRDSRPIRLSFARCHNRAECVVQFAAGTRGAARVRAELCPPPNADRPNDGQVKFAVDVGPMGCMGYEVVDRPVSNYGAGDAVDGGGMGSGGGGGDAPYVQRLKSNRILRILERTLLIGGALDAEALCVQSGAWVWRLHVDVSLLDDGGNAVDACVLAAVAALRHYRLPEVDVGGGNDEGDASAAVDNALGYQETTIVHSDDREPSPLPLHHTPLTATFALFADESGTTTAVSALLDPTDREELASDGLLTWSYNKYGEMCCLDFPGGCELRPRQLMASATLGKRRCVEICQLVETALDEAEGQAQRERMARLKALGVHRPMAAAVDEETAAEASSEAMDVEPSNAGEDQTDAAAQKEEEEYRQRALDYGSGHFAASVKEDKDTKKGASRPEKTARGGGSSSLFHAILRSAQSTAAGPSEAASVVVGDAMMAQKEEPVVEIVAHTKPAEVPHEEVAKPPTNKAVASNHPTLAVDSDEEEVVQLTAEFSVVPREREASASPEQQPAEATMELEVNENPTNGERAEKKNVARSKPKSKPPAEEEDVTDLTQALKKKKKSKKSKKK